MKEGKVEEIDRFLKKNFDNFKLVFAGGKFSFVKEGWEFQFTLEGRHGLRDYCYLGAKRKEK